MKRPLTVLSIAIASLGEVYREKSHLLKIASGVLKSGKYFANPELRAEQVYFTTKLMYKYCYFLGSFLDVVFLPSRVSFQPHFLILC